MAQFTTSSAEAIFSKFSKEKKRLLKSKIPQLRGLRDPRTFKEVAFRCYNNGRHDVEISGYDGVKYGFKVAEDGVQTEISKYTDTADDYNRLLRRVYSDAGLWAVTESFVRMVNKKGNHIKRIEVFGIQDIFTYFHPLRATVDHLMFAPNFEYTSRSLLNFKNLQSLVFVRASATKMIMEDILTLNVPMLQLMVNEYPDNSHLQLKSARLEVQEGTNTFEFFVQFVKKLCSGAHTEFSSYTICYFKEEEHLTEEQFYDKVATYFPSARPTTDNEEWQYPMVFDQSYLTLRISDELELNVRCCGWANTATVQKRGTAKPAINDSDYW